MNVGIPNGLKSCTVDYVIKSNAFKISSTIVIIALTALAYYVSRNLIKKMSFPAKVLVVIPALGAGGAIYGIWNCTGKISKLFQGVVTSVEEEKDDSISVEDDSDGEDDDVEDDVDFAAKLTDLSLYYDVGAMGGKFDPVHDALQELESESPREEDIGEEHNRLKKNPKVQQVFSRISSADMELKHFVALGHAIELREKLKKKYYVIIHGQRPRYMILNLVSKRLRDILNGLGAKGPADLSFTDVPLRDPCFLKHIKSYQTPEWFKEGCECNGHGFDKNGHSYKGSFHGKGDENYQDEIISGDAYFASTAGYESALHFFSTGSNIAKLDVEKYLKRQIEDCSLYKQKKEGEGLGDTTALLNKLKELANKVEAKIKKGDGNLYIIAIPKKKFKKCGYVSEAYGKKIAGLSCHADKEREVLKKLQNDQKHYYSVPQVRLLAHTLTSANGVFNVQESTFDKEFIAKVDKAIQEVINNWVLGEDFDLPDF